MGNLKQRLIKAGRDYNYAEGVKVKATTAVYADQIVYVDGSEGPYLTVAAADANGGLTSTGRLLIAKHDIPASGYGVCLPWKLVTTVATTGHTIGDPIYLADAPGSAAGANLVRACPTGDAEAIVVGRITKVGAVGTGAILVNAAAPEERVQGGKTATGSTLISGSPVEQFVWTLGAGGATTTVTVEYPIIVTDILVIQGSATEITEVNLYNGAASGGNVIAKVLTDMGTTDGAALRAEFIYDAKAVVAAEGTLRCVRVGGGTADLIVVTAIRG